MKLEKKNQGASTALLTLLVAAVLLALDQIAKYFVLQKLKPVGTVELIPGLLELTYVENRGAAFGLFQNVMWLVTPLTVAATLAILVALFRYKRHTFFSYATSALMIAGAIGNLVDRLLYGFVVDYIHVLFFGYIFNFADCCITVGAVLFVIHVVFFTHEPQAPSGEGGTNP